GGHGLFLLRHLQEASSQPLRMAQIYPPKHHGHQPQKYTRPLPPKLQKQHVVGRVLTLRSKKIILVGLNSMGLKVGSIFSCAIYTLLWSYTITPTINYKRSAGFRNDIFSVARWHRNTL